MINILIFQKVNSLKEHDKSLGKYAKIWDGNVIILCSYIIDEYTKL